MVSAAHTKKAIRADIRYIREMLRQMEAAIKTDDYAAIIEAGNEASCAASQIMQAASDYSGCEMP